MSRWQLRGFSVRRMNRPAMPSCFQSPAQSRNRLTTQGTRPRDMRKARRTDPASRLGPPDSRSRGKYTPTKPSAKTYWPGGYRACARAGTPTRPDHEGHAPRYVLFPQPNQRGRPKPKAVAPTVRKTPPSDPHDRARLRRKAYLRSITFPDDDAPRQPHRPWRGNSPAEWAG